MQLLHRMEGDILAPSVAPLQTNWLERISRSSSPSGPANSIISKSVVGATRDSFYFGKTERFIS